MSGEIRSAGAHSRWGSRVISSGMNQRYIGGLVLFHGVICAARGTMTWFHGEPLSNSP